MQPARTPEEARWMASVYNPAKAKRRVKYAYVLLTTMLLISIAWIIGLFTREELEWSDLLTSIVMLFGIANSINTLRNVKRAAADKQPE